MKKVSVIIPQYNLAEYLPESINSVIKQDYGFENIELILVDDHSQDNSYEIALSYKKKYNNVHVMMTECNSGSASVPRNMGLTEASGDYIMFLDSDDVLKPNAVSTLVSLMEKHDVDLVDGAYEEVVQKSKKGIERRYVGVRDGLYDLRNDIDEWFPICHPIFTKLYKSSIIKEHNILFEQSLRNGEDSLFLFKYMANAHTVWHVNSVIHEYRHRDRSLSHDFTNGYYLSFIHTYNVMDRNLITDTGKCYFRYFIRYTLFPNMDILCDLEDVDLDYCDPILKEYYGWIRFMIDNNIPTDDIPIGQILSRDVRKDDYNSYRDDFYSMRKLYDIRREMMSDVFNSRGWKLLTSINRFLRR